MKFEKLNKNKIKITLSHQDLIDKEIDSHIFLSNSIELQNIILNILEDAKKELNFETGNCDLKIEALSSTDTNLIFLITKLSQKYTLISPKAQFKIKKKTLSTQTIYLFDSFNDFCLFINFIYKAKLSIHLENLANSIVLYKYKNNYYLCLTNINAEIANKIKFYTIISEFAIHVSNSQLFSSKLNEYGKTIFKNNALLIASTYFYY